jgi:fatty acid amide hydrolase
MRSTITALSATEMAARIAAGELSAVEVADAHIARIEEVNGRLDAMVSPRYTEARAEAREVDAARARGEELGPLAGVPMTIKEQFDVIGLPTTFGLPNRRSHIARQEGPMLQRLRKAGAVILGKTNIAQFLFYQEADNPVFGRTSNPWNLDRTSGGGSGGEGAIIAAGGSPLGLAADVGGSIRTPAHFCGIQGFRPTSWRLTNLDSPPELFFPGFNQIALDPGPMARHVEDLALAMRVLSSPGQERIDPRIPPVPWREPAGVDIAGMRIAMFEDDGYWQASPALRRAVREAADALRARGAVVEPFTPPEPNMAAKLYFSFLMADGLAWAKPHLAGNKVDGRIAMVRQIASVPDALKPALAAVLSAAGQRRFAQTIMASQRLSTRRFWRLSAERDRWEHRFLAELGEGGFEAIICPPHAIAAMRHGDSRYLFDTTSYAVRFNVLGMPAGVVAATRVRPDEESDRKCGIDVVQRTARKSEKGSAGLPVGVQVAAWHWRDDIALAVMAALEDHFSKQPDYPQNPPC